MRGAMDGYHNFMGSYASSTGFFTAVSVVSLVCGVIVVFAALVLRVHPEEHVVWGAIIIAFSAVSFGEWADTSSAQVSESSAEQSH